MMKKLGMLVLVIGLIVSCTKKEGCTEPNAINYDTAAEENDGTCVYSSGGTMGSAGTNGNTTSTSSNTTNGNTTGTSSNTTNQNNSLGQVDITASWNMKHQVGSTICTNAYSLIIQMSGSSEDKFYGSPCTYRRKDLQAGTYSYTITKRYSTAACGTGQGVPADVVKSGSFTIKAGETTIVSAGYIN